MKEAAKGQIVILSSIKVGKVEAIIDKVEPDRIKLNWVKAVDAQIRKLQEGDEVLAAVHTSAGVKRMNSMIISDYKELIIENAPAISELQNRAFVRASVKIRIFIKTKGKLLGASTLDLSGGGVKFELDKEKLDPNSEIQIRFLEDDFSKDMTIKAKIIKIFDPNIYVANFTDIDEHDRDKIVRFCIKTLS